MQLTLYDREIIVFDIADQVGDITFVFGVIANAPIRSAGLWPVKLPHLVG